MTIPISIETLFKQNIVESFRIEWKSDFNPAPIIRTICAFANDIDNIGSGYIVIGVEEEKGVPIFPPKGIAPERIDSIMKKLLNYCHLIEPHYFPVAEPVVYQERHVILIWVKGGIGRPYRCPEDVTSKHSPLNYYIRKFSSTIKADHEQLKQLYYVAETIPFDDRPNFFAEVEDLDKTLIQDYLKEVNSSLYASSNALSLHELARNMQIVSGPLEDEHPLNVALLMFSKHPEKYFRYARLEVVFIPDSSGNNMIEKTLTGPIQNQLKDALHYLQLQLIQEKTIKMPNQAEAVRIVNYPFEAIEEILSNAIYHRSYQIKEPITVRISMNEIEITSHPGFDMSIRDEDIYKYKIRARVYRNRRIGDFLKELKLIEGRNTGFPNAILALKKNGSPLFQIESDPNRTFLSVKIPIHPAFDHTSSKDKKKEAYEQKILSILSNDALTLTELAQAMGYKGISAKLRKTINQLLDTKKLIYIAEGRNTKLTTRQN